MKSGEIGELALRRITGREGKASLALSLKSIVAHLCCSRHIEAIFYIFKNDVANNEITRV